MLLSLCFQMEKKSKKVLNSTSIQRNTKKVVALLRMEGKFIK